MRPRLLCLLLLLTRPALPQGGSLPARENLFYNLEWRLVTAGKASVEWSMGSAPRAGAQIKVRLESVGLVSKLFRVEDEYTATLSQSLCAQSVQQVSHEGSRFRDTRITFDPDTRKASYLERDRNKNTVVASTEIDTPACVHEIIGGLFYLRTLNLEPGQSVQVPVSDGKKSVMARVEAQQREDVKTPAGSFKTVRYEIYVFNNVLYRRAAHLNVWFTDDRRRLPVQIRVRMPITIGTLNLQLVKAE